MRSALVLAMVAGCKFNGGQLPDPDFDGPVVNDVAADGVADGPVDTLTGCASDFQVLADGNPGHKYKLVATPDRWADQHNVRCVTQGSYLAIPDNAAELGGLYLLGGNVEIWLGVSDQAQEGTFRDVLGQVYTALVVIGNNNADDCGTTLTGTTIETDDCEVNLPAVCECEE